MIVHTNLNELPGLLKAEAKRIEQAIKRACEVTAVKAVKPIRKRIPKAFGELEESVVGYSKGLNGVPVTSADAPHAGAVEEGSRPHTPDFRRLVEWVKLRGLQGLTKRGKLRSRFAKAAGPTTPRQARRVASMFQERARRGERGSRNRMVNDAAAEDIARAISAGIEKHGTKPHWFVKRSLPEIEEILGKELNYRIAEAKEVGQRAADTRRQK